MSRPPRFYLPELMGGETELDGQQAHHAIHVLRLEPGDDVEVFDGRGNFAPATVASASRRTVTFSVDEVRSDPPASSPLKVAAAIPKPDRARWLVEKLTELGVAALVPLVTERSVSSGRREKTDKLRQYVVEACRQCGRNTLMELGEPVHLAEALKSLEGEHVLYGDLSGGPLQPRSGPAVVFVGPEGGFSDREAAELNRCGAEPVRIGRQILRVETAAVAVAAVFANAGS